MLATDYFDLRAADSLRKLLTQAVALDERALEITQNQFHVGHAQTAADVVLNQFNAGTVSYTTVIIQMLIADRESLLTIQQNQLVADVSLIEALGGAGTSRT